jgi:hypothetical protein
VRLADDDQIDEAQQAILNHRWVEHQPVLTSGQLAELLPLLEPVLRAKRRLPSVPKEYRKPRQKTAVKEPEDSQHRGRRLVGKRSGGLCEIQVDKVCTGRATDWCHRRGRAQGGTWSPQNGLHGCHECHMWTHAHPSTSRVNGWICKSYDPIDTGVLRRGVWVVLDEEGGFELCPRRVA